MKTLLDSLLFCNSIIVLREIGCMVTKWGRLPIPRMRHCTGPQSVFEMSPQLPSSTEISTSLSARPCLVSLDRLLLVPLCRISFRPVAGYSRGESDDEWNNEWSEWQESPDDGIDQHANLDWIIFALVWGFLLLNVGVYLTRSQE